MEKNSMIIPDIKSYEQIVGLAKNKTTDKKVKAALVVPSDIDMLKAFARAEKDGMLAPVFIGDETLLKKNVTEHEIDIDTGKVIDINQPDMAVATALQMAVKGEIDLIVKGRYPSDEFVRVLFNKEYSFAQKGRLVSHIAVIKPQRYPKLLFITDAGITVQPDLKQKISLIQNLVGFTKNIGVLNPRVALLAAVEVIYPQMPVTTEAAVISKMSDRKQIKGAFVDGPLSFDVAIDMEAAFAKGIKDSEVAGQADAMVAPNIETANGIYTAMSLYGNAEVGGVIYGGQVPIALGSRSDSLDNKYRSIVLGVLAAIP